MPERSIVSSSDRSVMRSERAVVDSLTLRKTKVSAPAPVVIADSDDADTADGDVLVNLAATLPPLAGWARIAEVVDADATRRTKGRERFRAYRDRGLEPKTHDMGDAP